MVPNLRQENNNYRYYSHDQMVRLFIIKRLRYLGFSLEEVKNILKEEDIKRIETIVEKKQNSIKAEIEELNKKYDKRFESFKGGDYIAFYGENISQNLNYIEKILILTFIEEFNFLNFVNMNKDGDYVGKLLANKDRGNESGKYQALREVVEKDVINNILKFLQNNDLIDNKRNLKRVTSSLFAESPFFELTENQNSILNNILESNDKHIHLIKGGAGTGKTVLLLHLIARLKLKNKESKIAVFVKNTHRDRFKKILTSYSLIIT